MNNRIITAALFVLAVFATSTAYAANEHNENKDAAFGELVENTLSANATTVITISSGQRTRGKEVPVIIATPFFVDSMI